MSLGLVGPEPLGRPALRLPVYVRAPGGGWGGDPLGVWVTCGDAPRHSWYWYPGACRPRPQDAVERPCGAVSGSAVFRPPAQWHALRLPCSRVRVLWV